MSDPQSAPQPARQSAPQPASPPARQATSSDPGPWPSPGAYPGDRTADASGNFSGSFSGNLSGDARAVIQDVTGPGLGPVPGAGPTAGPGAGPGPAAGPAPGWYHDDNGTIRWWNGAVWDVGAPPPAPVYGYAQPGMGPPENRSMAVLAHVGAFVGGFILPLVLLLTTGKTDPFVRYHATESLDFQLTYLTFVLGGIILSIVTLGLGFLVFIPLLMVVAIGHIAFAIQACIAANRGEWYRYPVCIRYVKHT